MKIFTLPIIFIAVAAAQDVEVARVMARVDALAAQEVGKDARDVAALDRRARAEFKEIAPLGWRAAAPLGAAAFDPARSAKAKLFAVLFLGKLHDPAAAPLLSRFLFDIAQDPDARAAAASGLAALDIPPAAARRDLCAVIAQPDLPRIVLDEALIGLARLGCPDGNVVEKVARMSGSRPGNRDLPTVRRALTALSSSRSESSAKALLRLIAWFPAETSARTAAISALAVRRNDLTGALASESLDIVREAFRTERGRPESILSLIETVEAFGSEGDELLLALSAHPDAEVIARAAEALARRKIIRALPALEAVAVGALQDPRFSPKEGRPDPAVLLARLEGAIKSLRLTRAAAR